MRMEWTVPGIAAALAAGSYAATAAPYDNSAPVRTPYASHEALAIRSVTVTPQSVPTYGRIEITIDAGATFDNPFDAGDVAFDARIVSPSRKVYDVPGFYYQGFHRELKNQVEVLTPTGRPTWKVRFCPSEPGVYRFALRLRDRTGAAAATNRTFKVTAGKSPGMIRISERDPRYFAFENDKPYFPLGANLPSAGPRGTFEFDDWLPTLAKAGGNYCRLSLATDSRTFALEHAGKPEDGKGIGQYDLANAWRIDRVLEAARQNQLHLTLGVESGTVLSSNPSLGGGWKNAPHNAQNGGPLTRPGDFWTSEPMAAQYKNKLRYLVARYGASPSVLAWELWSEPDTTDGYASDRAHDWYESITEELRKLDPYRHLITSRFAGREGNAEVIRVPDLDFVQTNALGSFDPAASVASANRTQARYSKPHFIGEVAASAWSDHAVFDPNGLQFHDPLWASVALANSGSAQPGWGLNYVTPRRLQSHLTPIAKFTAGISWPDENFKTAGAKVEWRKQPAARSRRDLEIETVAGTWNATEINRVRAVLVDRNGATGQLPVASVLHGVHARPDLRNPIKFHTSLPWATRFGVQVRSVSGQGGGALRITVDGANTLERDFVVKERTTQPVQRFAGLYSVELPAGKHTVQVENVGEDWFEASYYFRSAVEQSAPPLQVWSAVGRRVALAWARPAGRTWHQLCELKQPNQPAPASTLVLPGLAPGNWNAELWDTWSGRVLARQLVTVGKSGTARVDLPAIERDLAIKLRRAGGATSADQRKPAPHEERHERKRRGGEEEDDD